MILLVLPACSLASAPSEGSLVATGLLADWTGKVDDPFIFVGTSDGRFHYLSVLTGELLWCLDTRGRVFGSIETGTTTYIPSLDGYLFTFVPNYGYRRVPLPIRDLAFLSPFRTESGEFFTSGSATTLYFVDESGHVISEHRSNSTVPVQAPMSSGPRTFIVVRVDYDLSVFGGANQIIKFSDFDIFMGARGLDRAGAHEIRVTTTFSGGVTVFVNDTVTAQVRLPGYPVAVFGSNGKFDFAMNLNGEPLSKHSVMFMNMDGIHVAVPSRPLTAPSKIEILTNGLPAVAGPVGQLSDAKFSYGVHEVRRPFFDFSTMRPGADPTRPANQMVDIIDTIVVASPLSMLPYKKFGFALFIGYVALRLIEFLCRRLSVAQKSGLRIVPREADPNCGTFNEMPCSLVRSDKTNAITLRTLHDLDVQGIMRVRAFEHHPPHFLIAYPVLDPVDFSEGFDPIVFLAEAVSILRGLFAKGFVHGSITEGAFFFDSSRNLTIGRLEDTLEQTDDHLKRSSDVSAVASVVRAHLPGDRDPLLLDVLELMADSAAPPDVLAHPIFWQAERRLAFLCQFSDVLQSNVAYASGVKAAFEAVGPMTIPADWMAALDRQLIADATRHVVYQRDLMSDLVRLIRNKWHHIPLDREGRRLAMIGTTPAEYFQYFHQRFPKLFITVYHFAEAHARESIPP
jgi:hypothetical protein